MTDVDWKANGEKYPDTNVEDGNGILVVYNKDGMENDRQRFKEGVEVYE